MATKLTDLELKQQIVKSSTPRLVLELVRAQNALDEDTIAELSRSDIISYIFHLRRISGNDVTGQSNIIQSRVTNFDISKMIFLTDVEEIGVLEKVITPKTPTVSGQAFFGPEYYRYLQEKDKTDRIRADRIEAEERALRAEKETKEQERLDEKERKKQERREKRRADEAARLAQEKLEEAARITQEKLDELDRAEEKQRKRQERKDKKIARLAQEKIDDLARIAQKRAEERIRDDKKALDELARLAQEKRNELARADRKDLEEELRRTVREGKEDERLEEEKLARATEVYTAAQDKMAAETRRLAQSARYDNRLANAFKTLRGQIFCMPNEAQAVILYLNNLDDVFNNNYIDYDIRPAILTQNLNEKGRNAHDKMSAEIKGDYERFKLALLKNFRVTPSSCLREFKSAIRQISESFEQYGNRLRTLYKSYLKSRFVETLEDLIELNLSDRFKESLTVNQRGHLGDMEQAEWLSINDSCEIMDLYIENHPPLSNNMGNYSKPAVSFNSSRGGFNNSQRSGTNYQGQIKSVDPPHPRESS